MSDSVKVRIGGSAVRVEELCSLKVGDIDLFDQRFEVKGKGGKTRLLSFSIETAMALKTYLDVRGGYLTERRKKRLIREGECLETYILQNGDALFAASRNRDCGGHMTPSGILCLVKRLGQSAGLKGVRCSPHTFRHTAATVMTNEDAPGALVQAMLGHSTYYMTAKYIHLSQSDVKKQHRRYSPVAHLAANLKKK